MHTWIELSRAALAENYRNFSTLVGPTRLAPVVKSNAYGHGLKEIYACLKPFDPQWLCTNYVSESYALRLQGFGGRLLVVGPLTKDCLTLAADHGIEVLISEPHILSVWQAQAKRPKAHVKFDTGMSRQGFFPEEAEALCGSLRTFRDDVVGVCSHFSNVEDVLEHKYAELQLQRFAQVHQTFAEQGFQVLSHISSSASALILPQSRYDLCRVGISMYGQWPSQPTRLSFHKTVQNPFELKPILRWKTRISQLKDVKVGAYIGYGCSFKAPRAMRIAVLPVGYYEGYPRLASNGQSHVIIDDSRCAIVGRICMNMMMVDVSHLDAPMVGDEVLLIGQAKDDQISATELAGWSQTIHYEVLSRLHPEMPRRILEHFDD